MAYESFEDVGVADAINANFVAVKVDQGGAPRCRRGLHERDDGLDGTRRMADDVRPTPDGDPFFAGTYFPRQQFLALLANVTRVWTEQRADVLTSGAHIAGQLRERRLPRRPRRSPPRPLLAQ